MTFWSRRFRCSRKKGRDYGGRSRKAAQNEVMPPANGQTDEIWRLWRLANGFPTRQWRHDRLPIPTSTCYLQTLYSYVSLNWRMPSSARETRSRQPIGVERGRKRQPRRKEPRRGGRLSWRGLPKRRRGEEVHRFKSGRTMLKRRFFAFSFAFP